MRFMIGRASALLLLLNVAYASNLSHKYNQCFIDAGLHYQVAPDLLYIIAIHESKLNAYAFHINLDGSYDIGVMQINSSWLPKLSHIGIYHQDLVDGCKNIQIGAWILAQNIKRYGFTLEAIGRYNSNHGYSSYVYKIFYEYQHQKHKHLLLSDRVS